MIRYPYKQMMALLMLGLFIILLGFLFVGCRSKKKAVQTNKSELATKKNIDSSAIVSNTIAKNNKETTISSETEKEETFEYQGELGDSLKIIKKGADGKLISETIYTGKGKIKKTAKTKNSSSASENNEASKKVTDSKVSVKKEAVKKESETTKTVAIEKSGLLIPIWLWIIAIITIVVVLWYINNKFSIFVKIKKFLIGLIYQPP